MKEKNLKENIFKGLFWKFAERIMAQGVSFFISVILARILLPEEYGLVSLIMVFITIANVFVSNGFGEALIQKSDADETDFCTIFYCSFIVSLLLYLLLFIFSNKVAEFYENDQLVWVLRILALKLPLSSINTIQQAYVSRKMLFKKFFYSTLGGTILSGIIGIYMAYYGFGVWALVAQYLINSLVDTIILFITVDWHPQLKFSFNSAKQLMSFGWKLTAAQLINTGYSQLRSLLIGKVYSSSDLAYYNRGNQFPQLFISNIDTSINGVLFPALAKCNSNIMQVKKFTRKSMRTTAYIIFPLMVGLGMVAETLISLILTDKWLECIPYLRWGCIYFAMQPIQTANWQAIKALGRSDICFKYEIVKKSIGIIVLIITLNINVYAVAAANGIMGIVMAMINMYPNQKLINYRYKEQFKDLIPSLVASLIMGGVVACINLVPIAHGLKLIVQIIVGIVSYIQISIILNIEEYYIIKDIIIKKIPKNIENKLKITTK